jgi:hypothetical protein
MQPAVRVQLDQIKISSAQNKPPRISISSTHGKNLLSRSTHTSLSCASAYGRAGGSQRLGWGARIQTKPNLNPNPAGWLDWLVPLIGAAA